MEVRMRETEERQEKNIITEKFNANSSNRRSSCTRASARRSKSKESVISPIYNFKDYLGVSVRLAKEIMSYPLLKQAWMKVEGERNAFSKLVNYNVYYLIEKESYSEENIITPGGRDMCLYNTFPDDNKLLLTFSSNELTDSFFPAVLYIFFCFNRLDGLIHSFTEYFNSGNENLIETQDGYKLYSPILETPSAIHKALESDPHPMVYAALTSAAQSDNDIFWTETEAVIFNEQDGLSLIMQEGED